MKILALIMTVLVTAGMAADIAADPAADGGVEPGRWQLVMQMQLPDKGWSPQPFSLTQCFTRADARDPSRILNSMISPGASDCHYVEKDYHGNRFHFALQCAGTFGITARGQVEFDGTHFSGTLSETANTGGDAPTTFSSTISGKRLGSCAG